MCYPVSFVQGNGTSRLHQGDHLGNNLFRFRNVYQNQTRRGQIERFSWQSRIGGVALANFHIVYSPFRKKISSKLDCMIAQFDSNHRARRAYPTRQQFEAPLGTTAHLNYPRSLRQSDLVEQLGRFLGEFLGLPLQAPLLGGTVAQKVLVVVRHLG
jgi:hypothetical protein